LDIYLPVSSEGDVNIQYHHRIVEEYENGPVYHDSEVDAVKIVVVFKFDKPVDLANPRVSETAPEA
jgi:hypothetical protein